MSSLIVYEQRSPYPEGTLLHYKGENVSEDSAVVYHAGYFLELQRGRGHGYQGVF